MPNLGFVVYMCACLNCVAVYVSLHVCISASLSLRPHFRSAFKAPLDPKLVLGGYSENSTDLIADATALLITLPVSNSKATLRKTEQWEQQFIHAVWLQPAAVQLDLCMHIRVTMNLSSTPPQTHSLGT